MYKLYYPVGAVAKRKGLGWNQAYDVRIVQHLLNEKLKDENIKSNKFKIPLKVDGRYGSQTEAAIDYFQVEKAKLFHHDSVISPKGPTLKKLLEALPEARLIEIWNDAAAHAVGANSQHAKTIAANANRTRRLMCVPAAVMLPAASSDVAPESSEGDNDPNWLIVPAGQLTFDAEGNDIGDPSNPLHRYFSRKVHWPGGVSGVTIGRGYDLGQRPNPEADLRAVGITEPLYSWLIGAKGLQGEAARNYLNRAGEEIRNTRITRKQQHDLFVPVYEAMKNAVIRISAQAENVRKYGRLNWDETQAKIKDTVVDLIYRGD
ncbi:MAG TPA: hypothetical protein VFM18_16180, partial [Methanosarcina sp.]|nr:hypothetical protein [Methanosarcina sp.]